VLNILSDSYRKSCAHLPVIRMKTLFYTGSRTMPMMLLIYCKNNRNFLNHAMPLFFNFQWWEHIIGVLRMKMSYLTNLKVSQKITCEWCICMRKYCVVQGFGALPSRMHNSGSNSCLTVYVRYDIFILSSSQVRFSKNKNKFTDRN